jgi:uncharacterized protein (UPF0335 family)
MTSEAISKDRLKQFVERIEKLEEDKSNIAEDIKEVYAEAKSQGFDTKTMRQVIKLRKKDREQLQEEQSLLDLYKDALDLNI